MRPPNDARSRSHTSEKELFCGAEKAVFSFRVCNGIETAHAHYSPDRISAAVIGIGVSSQNAAKVRLQPQLIRCFLLLSPLVDAITVDRSGNGDMDAHVDPRESVVTANQEL